MKFQKRSFSDFFSEKISEKKRLLPTFVPFFPVPALLVTWRLPTSNLNLQADLESSLFHFVLFQLDPEKTWSYHDPSASSWPQCTEYYYTQPTGRLISTAGTVTVQRAWETDSGNSYLDSDARQQATIIASCQWLGVICHSDGNIECRPKSRMPTSIKISIKLVVCKAGRIMIRKEEQILKTMILWLLLLFLFILN